MSKLTSHDAAALRCVESLLLGRADAGAVVKETLAADVNDLANRISESLSAEPSIKTAEDISKAIDEGKHWRKVAFAAIRHLKATQIQEVAEETGTIVSLCGDLNEMLKPRSAEPSDTRIESRKAAAFDWLTLTKEGEDFALDFNESIYSPGIAPLEVVEAAIASTQEEP